MAYLPQAYANLPTLPGNEAHSAHVKKPLFYLTRLLQEGGGEGRGQVIIYLAKDLCSFSGYQLITNELPSFHLSQTLPSNNSLIKETAQTLQTDFSRIAWIFQT